MYIGILMNKWMDMFLTDIVELVFFIPGGNLWDFSIDEKHFQFSSSDHLITEQAKGELSNKMIETENPLSQLKCWFKISMDKEQWNMAFILFWKLKGLAKLFFICVKANLASPF